MRKEISIAEKHLRELQESHQKSVAELAEQYLKNNPITHPLGEYVKKVFADAYTQGENIIDLVL